MRKNSTISEDPSMTPKDRVTENATTHKAWSLIYNVCVSCDAVFANIKFI